MCREKQDATSANILEAILKDEEGHIDYLETQLQLMDKLGEELYSAQCVSRPPGGGSGIIRVAELTKWVSLPIEQACTQILSPAAR